MPWPTEDEALFRGDQELPVPLGAFQQAGLERYRARAGAGQQDDGSGRRALHTGKAKEFHFSSTLDFVKHIRQIACLVSAFVW